MTSERFRPRLPLDPFAAIPWSIPQNLPPSHPQIILILGEPPIHDLIPLLTSTHLSHSLILIATDTPPLIPTNTRGPALRILRLAQPLAAHDAGALRLVSLLERAQRVAHLWLRNPSPHTIQLAQSSQNAHFSVIEPVAYDIKRYPSPVPSTSESVSSSKWPSALSPQSTPSPPTHKKLHRTKSPLKTQDDKVNYKLFDAIINFLPRGLPDKVLLKHAILVTTLAAQFLAPPNSISTTSPFHKPDLKTYFHSKPTIDTQKSISSMPLPTMPSPSHSHSYSSASQSTSAPSSGSTPDTSPCPSPPLQTSSKSRDLLAAPTPSSTVKKRFSLQVLLRAAPPSPSLLPRPLSEFQPLSEISDLEEDIGRLRKVKNAHLVHVLPVGWSPDSGPKSARNDKRGSSSSSPLKLGGPSRQPHSAAYLKSPNDTGGTCKPKLVESIEQFLLSFAYPLRTSISGSSLPSEGSAYSGTSLSSLSSSASNLNKRPKSARFLSFTEQPTTSAGQRPKSSTGLKGNAEAYNQENPLLCVSTLPSTSNPTISSNVNTPLKSAPYLLAPGVFGRRVLGSSGSNNRSSSTSEYGVDEVDRNHEGDTRGSAYMDSFTDTEMTTLTIGEIILLGALDFDHTRPGTGPGNGRAWIGNVGDVVIVGGGPNSRLSSMNAGVGNAKGRELVAKNTEMTKTTKRNVNVGLPTPEGSSSDNSAGSVEDEPEAGSSVGHSQIYARHIPAELSVYSSPTHLDDDGQDRARTPPGARNGERVEGVDDSEALTTSSTSTTSTTTKPKGTGAMNLSASLPSTSTSTVMSNSAPSPKFTPTSRPTSQPVTTHGSKLNKRKTSSSSFSTPTPTPAPLIINSKQNNNTSHLVISSPLPLLPSAVQVPPLVVHRDRARSPRGSEDTYDLGLGHGVPVPPVIVSKKPGSRSASSSGLGSGMVSPQADARSAYKETRSSMHLLEGPGKKGSERKGFVGALRKLGLWKSGGGGESMGVGLNA
ncbi:hypothetical protein BYT27DRAFT_7262773 [Phlegmacium glaucopus]|nr:hypothetical protein BYT27DRAFT_7262773 [Phlegmacium glaucopus]